MVPVYVVKGNSATSGVKVKVESTAVGATFPEINVEVEPCLIVNVVVLIVDAFMAVLKVAEITLLRTTSTALSIGSVETTIGQRPTSPVSSVTFLHPAAKTTSSNNINHLLLKILEQPLHVRNRVFSVMREGVFIVFILKM
jgi:hypothetical protein